MCLGVAAAWQLVGVVSQTVHGIVVRLPWRKADSKDPLVTPDVLYGGDHLWSPFPAAMLRQRCPAEHLPGAAGRFHLGRLCAFDSNVI